MKLHHYLFSFVQTMSTGQTKTAACTVGLKDQCVNQAAISMARRGVGMTDLDALLAVSYLGHMTMEEFDAPA